MRLVDANIKLTRCLRQKPALRARLRSAVKAGDKGSLARELTDEGVISYPTLAETEALFRIVAKHEDDEGREFHTA